MKVVTQDGNIEVVYPNANVMVEKNAESDWKVYVQRHKDSVEMALVSEYESKEECEFVQMYARFRLENVPEEPLVLPNKSIMQDFKQHIETRLNQKNVKDKLDEAQNYIKPDKTKIKID